MYIFKSLVLREVGSMPQAPTMSLYTKPNNGYEKLHVIEWAVLHTCGRFSLDIPMYDGLLLSHNIQ